MNYNKPALSDRQDLMQIAPVVLTFSKAAPNRKSSYRPAASSAGVRTQNSDDFFDDPPLPESFPGNFRAYGAESLSNT